MKWIDKIKTMNSEELAELLTFDANHEAACNVCWYFHDNSCCDLCRIGIKEFLESEVK